MTTTRNMDNNTNTTNKRKATTPVWFWKGFCGVLILTNISYQWSMLVSTTNVMTGTPSLSQQEEDVYQATVPLSSSLSSSSSPWSTIKKEENRLWNHRVQELERQWQVEQNITQQFLNRARQRRLDNEYQLETTATTTTTTIPNNNNKYQQYQNHYQKVQLALRSHRDGSIVYKPYPEWYQNSFADISIIGFPKAGTSQLYKLLITHQYAVPIYGALKEFCIDHGNFLDYTVSSKSSSSSPSTIISNSSLYYLHKKLWKYHKQAYGKRQRIEEKTKRNTTTTTTTTTIHQKQKNQKILLINACLQISELEYHIAYTSLPPTSKFIILFRDPADWLWASWNFWYDEEIDTLVPTDHDWTTTKRHYRSPELFHELIVSQGLLRGGSYRFTKLRQETIHTPRRIISLIGSTNLLCLKNEDMQPETILIKKRKQQQQQQKQLLDDAATTIQEGISFLDQLATFTGLDVSLFDESIVSSRRNCNSQKGFREVCQGTTTTSSTSGGNSTTVASTTATTASMASHNIKEEKGAYPITNYRPMLDVTRHLIYLAFHEECQVWAHEFGIVYEDCLNAVPSS